MKYYLSVLPAMVFLAGCGSGDGTCNSGVGNLAFENQAGESVLVQLSDATGPLPSVTVSANNIASSNDEYPVGSIHVKAVGQTSNKVLVDLDTGISCDKQAKVVIPAGASSFTAAHPPLPQVINNHGRMLIWPVFTAITFYGDAMADSIEKFVGNVGHSSFWSGAMLEYGVQEGSASTPVRVQELAPNRIDDTQIQAWLSAKLEGNHPEFPAPTDNSLYIIFYPESSRVTADGLQSCADFDGYHYNFSLKNGTRISYAVVMKCPAAKAQDQLNQVTSTASHEMAEASTDALPKGDAALSGLSQDATVWDTLSFGSEVGDLCQRYDDSYYTPSDLGFQVQRTWSNAAAAAGRNPCAPNSALYFNSAPIVQDQVSYNDSGSTVFSRGVKIPVGQSKTIALDLFSSGPYNGQWQLSAAQDNGKTNLSFSFDSTTGGNGDVRHLTITVNSQDPDYGAELFWVKSTLNGVSHYWPVVVGQ